MAISTNVYSSTDERHIYEANLNYNAGWTSATGDPPSVLEYTRSGQSYDGGGFFGYEWYRAVMWFDLRFMPPGSSIVSASLKLYGYGSLPDNDFNLTLQTATGMGRPAQFSDYDKSEMSGDGGSIDTSTWTIYPAGPNQISFDTEDLDWFVPSAWNAVVLRSDEDIAGTAPVGAVNETVAWHSGNSTTTAALPYLSLTYNPPRTQIARSALPWTWETGRLP